MRRLPITVYCCNCAKDNFRILVRSLASVNWCSQKIFLSDSSTEESKALARGMGWEIFEWSGPNSMSERRNYAINYEGREGHVPFWKTHPIMSKVHPEIKNKLIMQIDSDEVYEWDTYNVMKIIIEKEPWEKYKTFAFTMKSVTPDGRPMSNLFLDRMWQKGVYWEKDIQNTPRSSEDVFIVPCSIYHYGYGDNESHQIKQWNRLVLNEEEVRKDPKNIQNVMYLLNSLAIAANGQPLAMDRIMGVFSVGAKLYDESPKGLYEKHCLEKLLRFLWSACLDPNQKLYYISSAVKYYADTKEHPDVTYRLYDAHKAVGDLKGAILYGERYMSLLKHYHPEKAQTVMELTTAQDNREVVADIVGMSKKLSEVLTNHTEKKMYERKYKYWSKR